MKPLAALTLASSLVLGGCAQTPFVGTLVDRTEPSSQIALLKPTEGMIVHSIDGKTLGVAANFESHAREYEIGLNPGAHSAAVSYFFDHGSVLLMNKTWQSKEPRTIEFTVEAGHKYLLKPGLVLGGAYPVSWDPHTQDLTNNVPCWSVFALSGFFRNKFGCQDVTPHSR